MAVKSIIDIELRDGAFRDFAKLYDKYQKSLKSAPAAWALVTKNIDGSRASFKKLVDEMAAANVQEKLREKAQERANRLTETAADRWSRMARDTKEFAGNITSATGQLLKWASVTGIISGLIGAGGLFGIDRLAVGAASSRRSALGLGTGIGNQASFNTNFGRLIDPESFLASVAGAKFDLSKRVGLLGAGLSQSDINGDTSQTSVALLRRLKQIADTTNPALYAQVLQARRLDQFASPTYLERLHNTSGQEFEQVIRQFQQRRGQFDLPDDVAKKWQDFVTQLDNAGKSIETTLVRGLVNLEPGLSKLSEGISKTVGVLFEKGGTMEHWITAIDEALEKFADFIGTEEFQQDVRDFVTGIGKIADAIVDGLKWLGHGDPDLEASRQATRDRAAKLRQDRAEGKSTAFGQFLDIFRSGAITQDDLLSMIGKKEGGTTGRANPWGAIGKYQIKPGTAAEHGIDPSTLWTAEGNEAAARKILADYTKRYNGNLSEILAAYNQGTGAGDKFRSQGDNPNSLKPEGQRYISGSQGVQVTIENKTGADTVVSTNALKN